MWSLYAFTLRSDCTRARSTVLSTGLVRKSSAPASRALTRSSTSCSAVTMTTGMILASSSAFSRRTTSNPSIPGIMTSSRIRSGGDSAAFTSPSSPFRARSTAYPNGARRASISRRFRSSSSMTKIRGRLSVIIPPHGDEAALCPTAHGYPPAWRGNHQSLAV